MQISPGVAVRGRIEFVGQVRGKDDPIFRRLLLDFGILNPEYGIEVGDDIDTDLERSRQPCGYMKVIQPRARHSCWNSTVWLPVRMLGEQHCS